MRELALLGVLAVICVGFGATVEEFWDAQNLLDQSRYWVETGAIAVVMTLVIGTGGIDLNDFVQVDDGSLTIWHDFTAASDLLAYVDITLMGAGILDGAVDQRIDAETGTLWAQQTLTKTAEGDLYLAGEVDIDLDDTVDVQDGSLIVEDDFHAEADLLAYENITLMGEGILVDVRRCATRAVWGRMDGCARP